ncbi:hypothetical protein PGT21_006238 [Puccinia graminis f. sp. tritici]|uniref:Uncharacterized protein n=1 Tax=Puccinia graminis f. sp. tritici TaxID=56615 RepID=A0A5B0NMG8_PUCGR|nr:hypothetical protein PGT21_006238 [Puccinia graminis f. sp. tritici]
MSCLSTAKTSPSNLLSEGQVRELLGQASPMTHWTGLSKQLVQAEAASYIPEEGRPPKDLDNWILFEANVGAHSKEADDYIPEEGRPPKNLDNCILLEEHSQLLD